MQNNFIGHFVKRLHKMCIVTFWEFWLICFLHSHAVKGVSWEEWWTYDGISGPAFWGLINPEWSLCNKGRRQSPINLQAERLLFDPNLRILFIDKHRISGTITNTGHSVIFTVFNEPNERINITGGPLSYRYQFHEIHIHYGLHDQFGSEHNIDGHAFPAEIQIFGFNSQLYANFSEAQRKAQGIVVVALLLQLGDLSNPELRHITDKVDNIRFGGDTAQVKRLSIKGLLPETDFYMTYDGSTTMPSCDETVTWIILNKPIYITKQQMYGLRRLMQGELKHPKAPLGNNFRPPQPLHHRSVRTNIDLNCALLTYQELESNCWTTKDNVLVTQKREKNKKGNIVPLQKDLFTTKPTVGKIAKAP